MTPHSRRDISVWGSFAWGYADVGASIYLALGLVLSATHGAAWLAFGLAGLVYILVGFGYTELAAAYPVAGGGQYYAQRGLGDFWGFVAGAALLLDYTIDVALFSVASIGYLRFFWPHTATPLAVGPWVLHDPLLVGEALGVIVLLGLLQFRGGRLSSRIGQWLSGLDLVMECLVVVVGFIFAWKPDLLAAQWNAAQQTLTMHDFAYGSSLAIISFVGLESISQAAHVTRRPATVIPRTSVTLIFSVFLLALSISTLSLGLLPWESFRDHLDHPMAHLASAIPLVGKILAPVVACLGVAILALGASSGILSAARLTASMSRLQMVHPWFEVTASRGQPRRGVVVFALLGALMVVAAGFTPHMLETLANLYAFGISLAYLLVFISLIRLRFRDPYSPRPYRMPFNLIFRRSDGTQVSVPLLAFVGILGIGIIFVEVLTTHSLGRLAGPLWLVGCVIYYFVFRGKSKLPLVGSAPRDWEAEQIAVLTQAEEYDLLERYKNALEARDKTVTQKDHA